MKGKQAFLQDVVARAGDSFHRILREDEIEAYIEKAGEADDELGMYERDPNFRPEYIAPIRNALAFYEVELSPFYLVIKRRVPPDPSLFANAFNDGIQIYFNPINVALRWKWMGATTLTHEVGHIADSLKREEPILLLPPGSLDEEAKWIRAGMERRVNDSLPRDFKTKMASQVSLSLLEPTSLVRLMTHTSMIAPAAVPISATWENLAGRIYGLPETTDWLPEFWQEGRAVDDEAYGRLERAYSSRERKSLESLYDLEGEAFLLLDVLYDPGSEVHEASLKPLQQRTYELLRKAER